MWWVWGVDGVDVDLQGYAVGVGGAGVSGGLK